MQCVSYIITTIHSCQFLCLEAWKENCMLLINSWHALSWQVSFKTQLLEFRISLSLSSKAKFLLWIHDTETENTEADILNQTNGISNMIFLWWYWKVQYERVQSWLEIPVKKGTCLPNPRQSLWGPVSWNMNDKPSRYFNPWQGNCSSYCLYTFFFFSEPYSSLSQLYFMTASWAVTMGL